MPKVEFEIVAFPSVAKCEQWFAKHHADTDGVWIRFFKKASGEKTVTYEEAVEVALCYGWIDGVKSTHDGVSYKLKFTPRRKRSMWSQTNVERVARLTKEERMKPAGLLQVESAKADGRWDNAYAPASTMAVPADFLQLLAKDKKAKAFYESLNKANTYAIAWRLQTAKKPETRERRMQAILKMMKEGKKLH